MTPPQEYARLIRESRKLQLANNTNAVRRLEQMLARTAAHVAKEIHDTPPGIKGARYKAQLLAGLYRTLDEMRADYRDLLDAHIQSSAQIAADRERALLSALYQERETLRPDLALQLSMHQAQAAVEFGRVPRLVLERLYARTYRDGLTLSQRLYNLDRDARLILADEVGQGIALGLPARKLAGKIAPHLTRTGVDNVRYKAMRIARTEINTAYREGHVASVIGEDGKLKAYISALGFRLSPSHPRPCVCDIYADQDSGLGAGNYLPDDFPSCPHPHCICYSVSILADYPQWQFVSRAPEPDLVPEGQRKYYGL